MIFTVLHLLFYFLIIYFLILLLCLYDFDYLFLLNVYMYTKWYGWFKVIQMIFGSVSVSVSPHFFSYPKRSTHLYAFWMLRSYILSIFLLKKKKWYRWTDKTGKLLWKKILFITKLPHLYHYLYHFFFFNRKIDNNIWS